MGEDGENKLREGCGAQVATRPHSIKILKCCKSNFKSVKMAYLPTSVKVCLSRFHGVWNINSLIMLGSIQSGEKQSEQQNLKVVIKMSWFTLQTNIPHWMSPQYAGNVTLPWKPIKSAKFSGWTKKACDLCITDKNFQVHMRKKNFSKILDLAFKYKVMMIYNCS